MSALPRDDLYRASFTGGAEIRSQNGRDTLVGHFAVFNAWAEIESRYEGHFLERIAPGAFAKTFQENRDKIKVLFQHGKDPQVGDKPIGKIEQLREDGIGAYYEVALFDGIPPLVLEGLRAKEYGASFRFRAMRDEFKERPGASSYNEDGIPERTVIEAQVREYGPVVWPAYDGATAGVRSLTDMIHDVDALTAATPILLDDERIGHARAFISRALPEKLEEARTARRYDRIVEFVGETAWAIHPRMLTTIISIISERSAGYHPTKDEIRERIGESSTEREPAPAGSPLAVIPIVGTIMPHASMLDDSSETGTSIETLQKQFRSAMVDPSISSILFDVESPGGAIGLVPEFASEVIAARGEKPITAIANTWAASAAYWIASMADELVVSPSGQVGSIGVYTAHQDLSAQQEQKGVKTTFIKSGDYKTEGNPYEALSEDAQAAMQHKVDAYYDMFIGAIAKGRGVSTKVVKESFGQGRMVMASEAVDAGMADRVETYDQALARLTKQATKLAAVTTAAAAGTIPPVTKSDDAPPVSDAEKPAASHLARGRRVTPATAKWWLPGDQREVPTSWQ